MVEVESKRKKQVEIGLSGGNRKKSKNRLKKKLVWLEICKKGGNRQKQVDIGRNC